MDKSRFTGEGPHRDLAQKILAIGIARGSYEEHQHACQIMREIIAEITGVRFPLITALIQERLRLIDNFTVLHQLNVIMSTAWTAEDVLRFLLALDDAQITI